MSGGPNGRFTYLQMRRRYAVESGGERQQRPVALGFDLTKNRCYRLLNLTEVLHGALQQLRPLVSGRIGYKLHRMGWSV
jgi:hypothetical protein